jgi:hypothetical protein
MREGHVIQGWFPVYDTLLGVRCELSLVIRLLYFGDVNPFQESSAGVQFFGLSTLDPNQYTIEKMLGFVEELVVHADPEYSWSDNFRTSRKSNEHRQMLLYKLSSQVGTLVRFVSENHHFTTDSLSFFFFFFFLSVDTIHRLVRKHWI